jgi:L-rhamnose mutarotase
MRIAASTERVGPVQHFGLTLCLRDDASKIAEYRRQHEAVWPGVLARLRECGVHEMRIFLLGRRMFMYLETTDDFEPRRVFRGSTTTPSRPSGTG